MKVNFKNQIKKWQSILIRTILNNSQSRNNFPNIFIKNVKAGKVFFFLLYEWMCQSPCRNCALERLSPIGSLHQHPFASILFSLSNGELSILSISENCWVLKKIFYAILSISENCNVCTSLWLFLRKTVAWTFLFF